MQNQKMFVVIAKNAIRPFMAFFSFDEGDNKQLALDYAETIEAGGLGEVGVYLYEGDFAIAIPEEKGMDLPPLHLTFSGTVVYGEQITE